MAQRSHLAPLPDTTRHPPEKRVEVKSSHPHSQVVRVRASLPRPARRLPGSAFTRHSRRGAVDLAQHGLNVGEPVGYVLEQSARFVVRCPL
jgi:hypothetical protein